MPQKWIELKTYWVRLFCDECGEEMELTQTFLTYPQQYKYVCRKCDSSQVKTERFPRIDYRGKDA